MWQTINKYLEQHRTLGRTEMTLSNYKYRLKYFRAFCKEKKMVTVRNITITIVREYHHGLLKRNLSTQTLLAYLTTLRSFLGWCHQHKMIMADLGSQMELPKLEESIPPTPFSIQEVNQLLSLVDVKPDVGKRNQACLELLYGCGLRKEELLGVNVGDLDLEEETIFIRGKGKKDRILPMNHSSVNSVREYLRVRTGQPKGRSPLFITEDREGKTKRITGDILVNLMNWLCKKSNLHVHCHRWRHTFACHLLKGGADLRIVQEALGHQDSDTTSIYLNLVKDELKQEYDKGMRHIAL